MRAGKLIAYRSGNCSSFATTNADGSSYPRTGVNRIEGRHDLVRVVPVGGMPPTGSFVAPTLVGNHRRDYYSLKIQGTTGLAIWVLVLRDGSGTAEQAAYWILTGTVIGITLCLIAMRLLKPHVHPRILAKLRSEEDSSA